MQIFLQSFLILGFLVLLGGIIFLSIRWLYPDPRFKLLSIQSIIDALTHRQEKILLILSQANKLIVRTKDSQVLLEKICKLLLQSHEWDLVWIGLIDRDRTIFKIAAIQEGETGKQIALPFSVGNQYSLTDTCLPLNFSAPIVIPDLNRIDEHVLCSKQLQECGYRSLFIFPMAHSGHLVGLFSVAVRRPYTFRSEELEHLSELSDDLAYALINIKMHATRRRYEHQLLTLNFFISELVQIHDIQELMYNLLITAEELLKADASGIFLVGQNGSVSQTHTHNLPDSYIDLIKARLYELPEGKALESNTPVVVEDILKYNYPDGTRQQVSNYGVQALLALPVLLQSELIGELVVYYKEPSAFEDEGLQLGSTLAHTLAIAIQNAHLYQAEHSQRMLAEAVVQAAAALNSSLDLDEVLDEILEQTMRVVSCRSASISMLEDDYVFLVRRRGYKDINEMPDPQNSYRLPVSIPTLQSMLKNQQPILISDTNTDSRWTPLPESVRIKSYAGAPLLIDREVVGFLNIDSDRPGFFTEETTYRLEAFAAHAAAAIHNARLYQRKQQYANELEESVRERTSELQAAKEYIEGILTSVPDAIFVINEHGVLVKANQAGQALLQAAEQQDIALFAPGFLSKMVSGTTPSEENLFDIQSRVYQPLASNLFLEGQPAGKILVFRDVTRFQELDKMKTQFVSDVSHELRTPLTNITIYLNLLYRAEDETKREGYLDTLKRETGRLTHLIEDLLTISRLEAGRVEMYIKPLDINQLITDLTADRAIMAKSRGLMLICEPSLNLPPVLADARLLNQAVSNLMTNAINYTPSGKVILKSELGQNGNEGWVNLRVIDSGVGIPFAEIDRIFERFYRGSASSETQAPGTGLGLPISKEIIERMGGRISVESIVGQGSTFTVWLRAML